jgi:hypothetical protein
MLRSTKLLLSSQRVLSKRLVVLHVTKSKHGQESVHGDKQSQLYLVVMTSSRFSFRQAFVNVFVLFEIYCLGLDEDSDTPDK